MNWLIVIYLIGVILAYVMHKKIVRSEFDDDWFDVIVNLFLSLFSFMTILCIILTHGDGIFENIKIPKPPKWL